MAVLSESHISIHSWPEVGYAALDVFMCGDAKPHLTVDVLKAAFKPDNVVVRSMLRAHTLDERSWEVGAGKKAPVRVREAKAKTAAERRPLAASERAPSMRCARAPSLVCAIRSHCGRPRMTRWVEETFHPHWRVRLEATRVLHEVKTEHQHLVIFENPTWGTVLMLDGVCQLTTSDEFVYHEMMAHVPLMALDKPRRVLVVGGGDGGVLREVLKHPSVEKATLCEIDRAVIDLALQHYPEIAGKVFEDKRADVVIADGLKYVAETDESFDAIIVDSSEPIGPAPCCTRASSSPTASAH